MKYTDIKTLEDVYNANKQDMTLLPDVSNLPDDEAQDVINSLHLKRMVRAINRNDDGTLWVPNYFDQTEPHYEPAFGIEATADQPGGVGFSGSRYVFWHAGSVAGSRLVFRDLGRLQHAQKYFEDLFKVTYLILS